LALLSSLCRKHQAKQCYQRQSQASALAMHSMKSRMVWVAYSSSSSSTFMLAGCAATTGGVPLLLETAELRAAVRLCASDRPSVAAVWSMLGRAFLSGLPIMASGDTSGGAVVFCARSFPRSWFAGVPRPVDESPPTSWEAPGVDRASGSVECALFSYRNCQYRHIGN
jgi:hypothetical protein